MMTIRYLKDDNMKRLSISILLLFAVVLSALSQTVSVVDALRKAAAVRQGVMQSGKMSVTADGASPSDAIATSGDAAPVLAYTAKEGDKTCYYVFNYPDGGYAIIGGDEVAKVLLGYVETGSFDYSAAPDNVKWWLSQYKKEIMTAINADETVENGVSGASGAKLNEEASSTDDESRDEIPYLMKTEWAQRSPYNLSITGDTNPFPTGCVATAASQILKTLHDAGWAIEGKNKSYDSMTLTDSSGNSYETQQVNTAYEYDWDNMLDKYTGSGISETEKYAVADLMYRVGRALGMEYSETGSGASTSAFVGALHDCYGFDYSARTNLRDMYGRSEWEQLIYDELSRGVPVLYSAAGTESLSGHAFVLDGYSEESPYSYKYPAFHINWGWGGSYNGYFPISATVGDQKPLCPNGTGTGGGTVGDSYTLSQMCVTGLKLDEGNVADASLQCTGFTLYDSDNDVSLMQITAAAGTVCNGYCEYDATTCQGNMIINLSPCDVKCILGVKLVNKATGDVSYSTEYTGYSNYSVGAYSYGKIPFLAPSEAGVYRVLPAYIDIYGVWHDMEYNTDNGVSLLTVTEAGGIIAAGSPQISNNGYFSSLDDLTITLPVKNAGSSDASVMIAAFVFADGETSSKSYFWSSGKTIPAGSTLTVSVSKYTGSTTFTEGESYSLAFYYYVGQESGSLGLYSLLHCVAPQTVTYRKSGSSWGTLCLPFDASVPDGLTAYEITGVSDDDVAERTEVSSLSASTPYLINGAAGTYTFSGPAMPDGLFDSGYLVGNTQEGTTYVPKDAYVLQKLNGKTAFYRVKDANTQPIARYRAYLAKSQGQALLDTVLLDGPEATFIDEIGENRTSPRAVKVYADDEVLIMRNGTLYNINGQERR